MRKGAHWLPKPDKTNVIEDLQDSLMAIGENPLKHPERLTLHDLQLVARVAEDLCRLKYNAMPREEVEKQQ